MPTTPGVTLFGTLTDPGNNAAQGKVIVNLVNYGTAIPRIANTVELAQTTYEADAAADGTWSLTFFGNYQITPANTYYSVAIYKSATQGGADSIDTYQFNTAGSSNLASISPISSNPTVQPNQPLTAVVTNPPGTQVISTYPLDVPGLKINGSAPVSSVLVGNGTQYTASYQGTKISVQDYPQGGITPGIAKGVRLASSISSGAAILTLVAGTKYTFAVGDVNKPIKVVGAGSGGTDLYTTIKTFTSATQVTLNTNASTTVSSATAVWWISGQDAVDRAALEAASNAQDPHSTILFCPEAFYLYDHTPVLNSSFKGLLGDGIRSTFWCASNASAGSFIKFSSPPRWERIEGFSVYGPGYIPASLITNISLTSNVATITVANNFTVGQKVVVQLLTSGTFASGGLSLNNQVVTVATASATQFTFAFTHADIASAPDSGICYVLESAIEMNAGLWFGALEELDIYGFQGAGIHSITPILNTWHRIWVHNCGSFGYNIMVQPPTPVGATVHGMYDCYAISCYAAGFFGYYMQTTTIANCAFENCGGGMILDSCECMTITSPHLEQILYRNSTLPGKFFEMRGGRAIVVTGLFAITDSGGNVAQTVVDLNGTGTHQNSCIHNSIINPFYSYAGSAYPTTVFNFDSTASWNWLTEPFAQGGSGFISTDAGANNHIMYQGVEFGQGWKQPNIYAASGVASLDLSAISASGQINLFTIGDTQPRLQLRNDNHILFGPGGSTVPDWVQFRSTSGMHFTCPNTGNQELSITASGNAQANMGLFLDASNNGSLFFSPPAGGSDTFINRVAAGSVSVSTGSGTSINGGSLTAQHLLAPTDLTVGGGTAITKIQTFAPTLTPVAVAGNTSAEQTFTVTGLSTADTVFVDGPAPTAGTGIANVRVSSANTIAISWGNFTAGSLTPTSGTYKIVAVRS